MPLAILQIDITVVIKRSLGDTSEASCFYEQWGQKTGRECMKDGYPKGMVGGCKGGELTFLKDGKMFAAKRGKCLSQILWKR